GIADRGVHTDTRGDTRHDKVFDSELFEGGVQIGLVEAAKSCLVDADIAGLRFELVYDISIPGISDEDAAVSAIRRTNYLTEPEFQMARPVHRVGRAKVR